MDMERERVRCREITGTSLHNNIVKGVGVVVRLFVAAATLPRHAAPKTKLSGIIWIPVQSYNSSVPLQSVRLIATSEQKVTASARRHIQAGRASTASCGSWYPAAPLR